MCVSKPTKAAPANCVDEWHNVGSVQVTCSDGKLALTLQEERGFVLGDVVDVVATCANSAMSQKSSCSIANGASTVVAAVPGGVQVASSDEWDDKCVCKETERRPVLKLQVNDVIAGAASLPGLIAAHGAAAALPDPD